jgi:hypothetical protein
MQPTMLCLFNSSTYAVQPWIDEGYTCVSVDYSDSDHAGDHRKHRDGNSTHVRLNIDCTQEGARDTILETIEKLYLLPPSFVLSFAPCTHLAVCGNRSRAAKLEANPNLLEEALALAVLGSKFGVPYIVENPVSLLASLWRPPTGYVHPWHFAAQCPAGPHPEFPNILPPRDMYNKKTGLWCGSGARMPLCTQPNAKAPDMKDFPGYTKLGGKSARTKYIRSLTPRGLAQAICNANVSQDSANSIQQELFI